MLIVNADSTDHGGGIFTDVGAILVLRNSNLSLNIGKNRAGGNLAAYNSFVTIEGYCIISNKQCCSVHRPYSITVHALYTIINDVIPRIINTL